MKYVSTISITIQFGNFWTKSKMYNTKIDQ